LKWLLAITGLILVTISGTMLYKSYQQHLDPQFMYGDWIEIQVLSDRNEVLTLSSHSVLRNHRLVATHFEFDGSKISFHTGEGDFVYDWNGSTQSPQLERLKPAKPKQTLIKQGYEHTLEEENK
jgi:cell division protein YceG involved in septum cleavage